MDWFKIKTGHVYGTNFTLLQIGALITIQAMTAHFERIPTDCERRAVISDKLWTSLAQALHNQSTTIAEVLQEVCNDIARVMEKQRKSNAKIQKFRDRAKKHEDVTVTTSKQIDKIDKIDKIEAELCVFDFEGLWFHYPKPIGKKMAKKHFDSSVKTAKDFEDISKAMQNYCKSDTVAKGFIQNGSTWFNNWRDWIDYKPITGTYLVLNQMNSLANKMEEIYGKE